MMPNHLPDKPPILIRKKFQVAVEVEVSVFEMPNTLQETTLFNRIAYEGDEAEQVLFAENVLRKAMLKCPRELDKWLAYHATCAVGVEHLAFGECRNGDAFLDSVLAKLPEEQREILASSTKEAVYHAVEASISSVLIEDRDSDVSSLFRRNYFVEEQRPQE